MEMSSIEKYFETSIFSSRCGNCGWPKIYL